LIVLDENILDSQRLLLQASRVAAKQVGVDCGRKGLPDEQILVSLRQGRNITFFTRDSDFYAPDLRHQRYCLVMAAVGQNEAAAFVRRFLRHPGFDTQAKRMGRVVRLSHVGLAVWCLRAERESHTAWLVAG